MKNRENQAFGQLRLKLFLRTAATLLLSVAAVYGLYTLVLRGNFAQWSVSLLQTLWDLDYGEALALYERTVRQHVDGLIWLSMFLAFLGLMAIYLRWFTGYFTKLSRGMDAILEGSAGEIQLPPELLALAGKMNAVKGMLQQQKHEMQLAEQRKNDLVMYLAHDLKTPLASSISYLNLLLDQKEIPQALREKYLSIALGKAERLEELINEFLDCAKFNLSHVTLQYSQVDLTRLLEQLVYEFQPFFAEKDLGCQLTLPETATLRCDGEKMQRVFDNLLRNAVLYSDDGSEIGITLQQQEDSVTIRFQNHGPTIPQEKLERIFEQFYRLDTGRSTSGTGLGLAIARQIVTLHRGSLTAESEEALTTFAVTLPLL